MFGVVRADKGSDSWILKGVTGAYWKNALKHIHVYEHAVTKYHLNCMVAWKTYLEKQAMLMNSNNMNYQEGSNKYSKTKKLFIASWI